MKLSGLQVAGLLIVVSLMLADQRSARAADIPDDPQKETLRKLGLALEEVGSTVRVKSVSGLAEEARLQKLDIIRSLAGTSINKDNVVAVLEDAASKGNFTIQVDRGGLPTPVTPEPKFNIRVAETPPPSFIDFGFNSFEFDKWSNKVRTKIKTGSLADKNGWGEGERTIQPGSPPGWSTYSEFLAHVSKQAKSGAVTLNLDPSSGKSTVSVTLGLGTSSPDHGDALEFFGITRPTYNVITTDLVMTEVSATGIAFDSGIRQGEFIRAFGASRTWNSLATLRLALKEVSALSVINIHLAADSSTDDVRQISMARAEAFNARLNQVGLILDTRTSADGLATVSSSASESYSAGIRSGDEIILVNGNFLSDRDRLAHAAWKSLEETGKVTVRVRLNSDGKVQRDIVLPRQVAPSVAEATPLQSLTRGIGSGKTGKHVAFPEFIGPAEIDDSVIKGDSSRVLRNEVVTARVELYYFRDAHRVAQIINRNVKSFNAAAVTTLQRAAETARDEFESAKFSRKEAEQAAREAAIDLRQKENRLATLVGELRSQLQVRRALDSTNDRIQEKEVELAGATNAAEKASIQAEITRLTVEKNQLERETARFSGGPESTKALQSEMQSLLGDIEQQKALVIEKQAESRKKENQEELAAKNQFRREVSAAKVDPDTYVPGDLDSVDPVSQVSISVIGEGVLHLRGPRAGVVRIRQMLNQIDHPVGQVKIGVMTIQLNGESGARMDNTVRRMEGHLSRGRFLTNISENLFRRAVAEVSANVASQSFSRQSLDGKNLPTDGPISRWALQSDRAKDQNTRIRWHAYLSAFFGADFLEEIADVYNYSVTFDPFNKLVSLSSADSLTLAEAMLITGLAKWEHRQAIGARFQYYLRHYLPEMDARWIETNRIRKSWDPRAWGDELCSRKKILEHGMENYRFNSTMTLFDRDFRSLAEQNCLPTEVFQTQQTMFGELQLTDPTGPGDRLNSLQREVVKLVQGMTIEAMLRARRESLIKRRELLVEAGKGLTGAEAYLVETEIDDLTDRQLDAMDALRGRKAALDRLIKQAVIAMEDDVYAQFYNPAIDRIRMATEEWDVELGTVERTTILTNNRAFGKVAPQATFEFDLPKRDIAIAEALKSAYALHKDLGPLLGDPNFATLTKMFAGQSISGSTVDGSIKNILPGLPTGADHQTMLYADSSVRPQFGTELEKLIPDPAIYKFETGTGFEVRPVVQPDGQSVVFDFDYMYTTDLLEPTRPDERKLGRVKRHFVNTEVQLGNLEWREISRYEVSLKAARNGRGVPLLEDIPVVGLAFRPLPQAKKSIQKNVIVGQASIYPTIEDLLGLRPGATARIDVQGVGETINGLFDKSEYNSQKVEELLDKKVGAVLGFKPPPSNPQKKVPVPVLPSLTHGTTEPPSIPMMLPSVPGVQTDRPSASPAPKVQSPIEQTGYWKPAGSAPRQVAAPRARRILDRHPQ